MPADAILPRLEKVRQHGPGRWSARCPAHKDRTPSLSIAEQPDGRVLMHCFGGCPVDAILAAVGLDMDALFPPRPVLVVDNARPAIPPARPKGLHWHAIARIAAEESLIAAVLAADAHKRKLTPSELDRLWLAAGRLQRGLDLL